MLDQDGLEATLVLANDWNGAYQATGAVTNVERSPGATSWRLVIDLHRSSLAHLTGPSYAVDDSVLTLTGGALPLGASASFEFDARKDGEPYGPGLVSLIADPPDGGDGG